MGVYDLPTNSPREPMKSLGVLPRPFQITNFFVRSSDSRLPDIITQPTKALTYSSVDGYSFISIAVPDGAVACQIRTSGELWVSFSGSAYPIERQAEAWSYSSQLSTEILGYSGENTLSFPVRPGDRDIFDCVGCSSLSVQSREWESLASILWFDRMI
jgi:hypothetical protein